MQVTSQSAVDLDLQRLAILKEGLPDISNAALRVLLVLLKRRGQVVTYDRLSADLDRMAGTDQGHTNSALATSIKRLRKGLKAAGWPVRIRTHWRLGYQLIAPHDWDWRPACTGSMQ